MLACRWQLSGCMICFGSGLDWVENRHFCEVVGDRLSRYSPVMRMHLLSGGRLKMQQRVYYPSDGSGAVMDLPVSCALFKHSQANVLFDTGCHPDAALDGPSRWGEYAKHTEPIFEANEAVIGQLALAGLSVADVDLVICSHLHYDHCGCNAFFPQASVIVQELELAAASKEGARTKGYLRREWETPSQLTTIDGQHDVFGDGRLTLLHLPGHTPGMMGAMAQFDRDGVYLIASDAVPVAECLSQQTIPANNVDPGQFTRSVEEVLRLQQGGASVIFGHDARQWDQLKTGSYCYE